MPIIISRLPNTDIGDVSSYEVAINEQRITVFNHIRGDGLAYCLKRAADAVELARPEHREGGE